MQRYDSVSNIDSNLPLEQTVTVRPFDEITKAVYRWERGQVGQPIQYSRMWHNIARQNGIIDPMQLATSFDDREPLVFAKADVWSVYRDATPLIIVAAPGAVIEFFARVYSLNNAVAFSSKQWLTDGRTESFLDGFMGATVSTTARGIEIQRTLYTTGTEICWRVVKVPRQQEFLRIPGLRGMLPVSKRLTTEPLRVGYSAGN